MDLSGHSSSGSSGERSFERGEGGRSCCRSSLGAAVDSGSSPSGTSTASGLDG